MSYTERPLGVTLYASLILALSTVAFFWMSLTVLPPPALFIVAFLAGLGLGLMYLKPWAWWTTIVFLAPLLILAGVLCLLVLSIDLARGLDQYSGTAYLVGYPVNIALVGLGALSLAYFLSTPVRDAFCESAGQEFPVVSTGLLPLAHRPLRDGHAGDTHPTGLRGLLG